MNKWLDECCNHMHRTKSKKGYWTKEICLSEAKKFKTKKDWNKYSRKSYGAAHKHNWIDICSKHMKFLSTSNKRIIYSFEFKDNHVYVGLTYSPKSRKNNHLINKKSAVLEHIIKTNENPTFKILTNFLPELQLHLPLPENPHQKHKKI